jgi:hypothetical protein
MSATAWTHILVAPAGLLAQAETPTISLQSAVIGGVALAAICFAAGYWFRNSGSRSATQPRGDSLDAGDLPEELVVVIAAAVAESLGPAHRIVRIRGLMPEDLGWQLEGRLQHHASHHPHR